MRFWGRAQKQYRKKSVLLIKSIFSDSDFIGTYKRTAVHTTKGNPTRSFSIKLKIRRGLQKYFNTLKKAFKSMFSSGRKEYVSWARQCNVRWQEKRPTQIYFPFSLNIF